MRAGVGRSNTGQMARYVREGALGTKHRRRWPVNPRWPALARPYGLRVLRLPVPTRIAARPPSSTFQLSRGVQVL